jgi:hypothetical protein
MTQPSTHKSGKRKPRPHAESRPIRPCKTYARNLSGGLKLKSEVSPCVFMYSDYPLQIRVTLTRRTGEYAGDAYSADRSKTSKSATEADVRRLLAAVRIIPCRRCAAPAFDPATIETNRAGLCEACFLSDLEADIAQAEEAERQEIEERDRRMKAAGMRFRVSAWVHPESGGDDYQMDCYFAATPTDEQIRGLLRGKGSRVLDDYRLVTL